MRPRAHDFDDIRSIGVPPQPVIGGFTENIKGYPMPPEDRNVIIQRQDVAHGISPGIPDIERPNTLRNVENLPPSMRESNILFVDGLPKDCTRREVGRILLACAGICHV